MEAAADKESSVSRKSAKDKAEAEEMRNSAMETFAESSKRKSLDGEESFTPKRSRKSGSDTLVYLRTKAEHDFELKKEELELKKRELDEKQKSSNDILKTIANMTRQPNNKIRC